MPVNPSLVGRAYPPTDPYRVSREKIREFADAVGDPNPAYRSAAAAQQLGHADVVAPPTFPIVLTIPAGHQALDDPDAGIDYSRVVHGEQRFAHERPVLAGDTLTVTVHVDDVRTAAGNELVTTRSEVHDADGALVVTGHAIIVVRGEGK